MKKRLLTVLLAICMIMALSTISALANDAVEVSDEAALTNAINSDAAEVSVKIGNSFELTSSLTIPEGKSVTMDLDGQTLSFASGKRITLKGSLIINDTSDEVGGTISGTAGQLVSVADGASLTLNEGNITTTGYGAVRSSGTASTFNMNGGSVTGSPAIQALSGNVTISGGIVSANSGSRYKAIENTGAIIVVGEQNSEDHSSINIESINVGKNKNVNLYSGTVGAISGTFTEDAVLTAIFTSDITGSLPAGYISKPDGEGHFVVSKMDDEDTAASVLSANGTETKFASLDAAVSSLGDGDTLKLYKDFSFNQNTPGIDINKANITLDVNGHSITVTNTSENASTAYGVRFYRAASDTISLVNTSSEKSVITGYNAAVQATTNSSLKTAIVTISGDIELVCTNQNNPTIELGYAKLAYSEAAAAAVKNGGFKATEESGESFIFGTASAAINADSNNTAILLNDFDTSTSLALSSGSGIIDLNGRTVTTTSNNAIAVNGSNVNLTVRNGFVVSYGKGDSNGWPAGAFVSYAPNNFYENSTLTLDSVNITLTNAGYGVVVSGNDDEIDVNILNCDINVPDDGVGIYFPPKNGDLVIKDSQITAGTGVIVKGGIATIVDSTILAKGEMVEPSGGESSGAVETGDAVYLEGNYNDRSAQVNIEGGNFVSENGYAVQMLFEENSQEEKGITVSGGNFSSPINKGLLDTTLKAELYSRANPDAPYSYYNSVDEALEAAEPGDVVTDITNATSDETHEVKFDRNGNGEYEIVIVRAGATITFTAPTRSGYEFRGWRDGSGELHKAGDVVTVNSDMTFTAVWSAVNIPDTYDIEIANTANGSVDTSLNNASAGSTITITATPDSGYSVASVTVTGPDGRVDVVRVSATTYTFKMPAGDVTVRVTFTDSEALPFTDVSAGQWFYDAVAYVYTNGMMEGDSATTFNPDGTMTRAMFWAVLGRIDGATITGTNWADQARDWAMAEGVSDGTDPNGLVTREQMVTMLWRYAGEPESTASLSAYTDADSVSDWAETAMRWAIDEGIITGMTDTTLVPQGTATRAQCAAIFMRFDQM